MPANDIFFAGVGQNPGLDKSNHDNGMMVNDIELPSDSSLFVPHDLGNVKRDDVLDDIAQKTADGRASDTGDLAASGKSLDISWDGMMTEAGDDIAINPMFSTSEAREPQQDCQLHSPVGEKCRCLTATNLAHNDKRYIEIRNRVLAGAKIRDYPVVEVFGIKLDREDLYRKYWGYKMDKNKFGSKRSVIW